MAGDTELIEALRRNAAQSGKLVLVMGQLAEAIRLQAEAQQDMAKTIAKVAAMDAQPGDGQELIDTTNPDSSEPAPARRTYLDDRGDR